MDGHVSRIPPPYLRNPDGSPPNYDHPVTLVSQTGGITIAMFVITSYFVITRLFSKAQSLMKFGIDDCLCITAFVLAITYGVIVISMPDTARHSWDVSQASLDEAWAKRIVVLGILYGPAIWFAKAAILALYLRLFSPIQWLRTSIFLGLGFLFPVYWASIPVFAIYCTPKGDGQWNSTLMGTCQDAGFYQLFLGAVGVASDLYLLALPLPAIFNLHLSLMQKLGVAFVFLHGIFAVISSTLALYYRELQWIGTDPTWNMQNTNICLIVEMFMTIIVSSMPATSAFWRVVWQQKLSQSRYLSSIKSLLYSSRVTGTKNTKSLSNRQSGHIPPQPALSGRSRSSFGLTDVLHEPENCIRPVLSRSSHSEASFEKMMNLSPVEPM